MGSFSPVENRRKKSKMLFLHGGGGVCLEFLSGFHFSTKYRVG